MTNIKITWVNKIPKNPGIKCMGYNFTKMTDKEKEEKPCEHGWVKSEREPFCHYCEGCCF